MLIDSHCHVPHEKYKTSTEQILKDCEKAGVSGIITIGTSEKENLQAIETAENFENIYCTVAIYPHEEKNKTLAQLEDILLKQIKLSEKIVAIGECGIDISNWEGGRAVEDQIELFDMQVRLALENNLPVCVHNRHGDDHILNVLKKYTPQGLSGVVHCFDSNWDFARKILDIGFYVSFSALITYPNKNELHEVVKNVPLDRFLVETDAPYLPPQGHRGEVNFPKYVKIVASKVSEIKQIQEEKIEEYSFENTCALFNINNGKFRK